MTFNNLVKYESSIGGVSLKAILSDNDDQSYGFKSVQWDATNNQGQSLPIGVYLYIIETKNFRQTKKMILLK